MASSIVDQKVDTAQLVQRRANASLASFPIRHVKLVGARTASHRLDQLGYFLDGAVSPPHRREPVRSHPYVQALRAVQHQ